MSSLFPLPPTSERSTPACAVRETLVVWDIDDYSIPESIDPGLINERIKAAIVKHPFLRRRKVSIWIYGAAENTWLKEMRVKLWESGFEVYLFEGDKRAIFNRTIGNLVFWAWNLEAPTNLLMLSKNKEKMEQDPKFCRFRQAFENKGFFVASAHPDTLINQEIPIEEPDYSPIPYYQNASDNTLKLAYWTKEDAEACRSKRKEVRGNGRPRKRSTPLFPMR